MFLTLLTIISNIQNASPCTFRFDMHVILH